MGIEENLQKMREREKRKAKADKSNSGPTPAEREYKRLAGLSTVDYEREREAAAEALGMRVSALDREVNRVREKDETKVGQGRALALPEPTPWPEPVDGAKLLSDIVAAVTSHVVMPAASADALVLWVLHAHAVDAFNITPRLAIMSPEKQCGKTTLLDVVACLVWRPLPTANATMASLFRAVEMQRPTLLLDEADRFVTGENDELLGVLNSGHRKGGSVLRTVGDDLEPRMFSTFSPCAFALIGRLPDTLEDRSVIIELRRRTVSEAVTLFRLDRAGHLDALARKAVRWAADHLEELREVDPDVGALFNRVADNWRPLLAIADLAGGEWPDRARAAATAQRGLESSIGIELLEDIQAIFTEKGLDRITSEDLAGALAELEGRPWAEWGRAAKPISQNALARQLKKFKTDDEFPIAPLNIRLGGRVPKGYLLSQFGDAFARYLASIPPSQPPHRYTPTATGTSATFTTATTESDVAVGKCEKPHSRGPCSGVAVGNLSPGGNGHTTPSGHPCDQCQLDDGKAQPHGSGEQVVWLHAECLAYRRSRGLDAAEYTSFDDGIPPFLRRQ